VQALSSNPSTIHTHTQAVGKLFWEAGGLDPNLSFAADLLCDIGDLFGPQFPFLHNEWFQTGYSEGLLAQMFQGFLMWSN
jgi:hypothetical protein